MCGASLRLSQELETRWNSTCSTGCENKESLITTAAVQSCSNRADRGAETGRCKSPLHRKLQHKRSEKLQHSEQESPQQWHSRHPEALATTSGPRFKNPQPRQLKSFSVTEPHTSTSGAQTVPASRDKLPFTPVSVKTEVEPENMNVQSDAESSSGTDRSEDWTQEQSPSKRSYAMISPGSDVGGNAKPHRCSECGKEFQRKTTLNNHMLLHTGQKPFKCSVCEKAFRDKGNLKVHMRTHTGEKPFSCQECDAKFTHKLSLDRHMSVHSTEGPFSCPFCKKDFVRNSTFKTHLRFHTGETPHNCPYCSKGFTLKSHLSSHVRSHTGEKPFSCSVCKKLFSHKGNLKAHMALHKTDSDQKAPSSVKV